MFPELTRDDVFRLETKRLWLRWPRAADAAALAELAAEMAARGEGGEASHRPGKAEADRFILAARRENAEGAALNLVLARRARPQEAIGALALSVGSEPGAAALSFWLGPRQRGEGLMAEAVSGLARLALDLPGLDALEATASAGDAAAGRVLAEAGFTKGGDLWRLDRAGLRDPFAAAIRDAAQMAEA